MDARPLRAHRPAGSRRGAPGSAWATATSPPTSTARDACAKVPPSRPSPPRSPSAWDLDAAPAADDRRPRADHGDGLGTARVDREIGFQDYFVGRRHSVPVSAVRFAGADDGAARARRARRHRRRRAWSSICPSNPLVSIGPILAVPGIEDAVRQRRERVVAISPIVAGAALKGPADRHADRAGPRVLRGRRGPDLRRGRVHARHRRGRRRPGRRRRGRRGALRRGPHHHVGHRPRRPRWPRSVIGAWPRDHAHPRSTGSARSRPGDVLAELIAEATAQRPRRGRAARRRRPRRDPEDRVQGRGPPGRGRPRRPAVPQGGWWRPRASGSCGAEAT